MNIWRQIHDKHNISPIPYKLLNMETNSFMGTLGWDILENSNHFLALKQLFSLVFLRFLRKKNELHKRTFLPARNVYQLLDPRPSASCTSEAVDCFLSLSPL